MENLEKAIGSFEMDVIRAAVLIARDILVKEREVAIREWKEEVEKFENAFSGLGADTKNRIMMAITRRDIYIEQYTSAMRRTDPILTVYDRLLNLKCGENNEKES